MGIFKNAEKSNDKHRQEVEKYLLPGEEAQVVYSSIADWVAVTPVRLIFINTSWTSSQKTITSVPFSKIISVHMNRGGFMQITKEIVVTISGRDYEIKLLDADNAMELYSTIAERIL